MRRIGPKGGVSRRTLLVGGGAGAGLVVAWALWPRSYAPNLRTAQGETLFNAFLKIGLDGRVIVAVPQSELGQGTFTSLPQILADELGADWRTVSVEPAPISPLYANTLVAEEEAGGGWLPGLSRWIARENGTRDALMLTGGSSSIRAFEPRLREAGAGARALLMQAAADRWDVDWEELDTAGGFVIRGNERLGFAALAEEAAGYDLPDHIPIRGGPHNRLTGQDLPRLDLPAKVDGSAQFAADIRLPDMVYASVRQGPRGEAKLVRVDRASAEKVPGLLRLFEQGKWVGAVASNWWAANKAVEAMKPVFEVEGPLASTRSIDAALAAAMAQDDYTRFVDEGDVDGPLSGNSVIAESYSVGLAANAPIEPLTATARFTGDRLEVWAPVQAQNHARAAAARAVGISEGQVALYPTLVGGGYGRKIETLAIEQAVVMAKEVKRPVQLTWSRVEETMQDLFRPPARAEIKAAVGAGGVIQAWRARIAAPSTGAQVAERVRTGEAGTASEGDRSAVAGARPPYAIPAVAVDHLPVDIGIGTGLWRSAAHSYTCFFTESFIDEVARKAGLEPLSYRMQMLGNNPRLARVLQTAAALGGWDGGAPGSAMGLACHSAFGSHIALVVEIEAEGGAARVLRAVAAVDCGRVVNPNIVRQLVEGGIVHGISGALGAPISFDRGLPDVRHIGDLGLQRLASSPEVSVEIIPNDEDPGGVTELAVPPTAPAIANALFASTGRRVRSLPLTA